MQKAASEPGVTKEQLKTAVLGIQDVDPKAAERDPWSAPSLGPPVCLLTSTRS